MNTRRADQFRTFLRRSSVSVLAILALVATALLAPAPASAVGTTYTVTSDSGCGQPGSFEDAMQQANANPGRDTIAFTPGPARRLQRVSPATRLVVRR